MAEIQGSKYPACLGDLYTSQLLGSTPDSAWVDSVAGTTTSKRGDLGRFATSTSRCIALVPHLQSIRRLPNVSTTSTAPISAKGFSLPHQRKRPILLVYTNTSPPSPQVCPWRKERRRCEMDGSVAHCAGGVSATETISWSAPVISNAENANSYPPMCHGAVGENRSGFCSRGTRQVSATCEAGHRIQNSFCDTSLPHVVLLTHGVDMI